MLCVLLPCCILVPFLISVDALYAVVLLYMHAFVYMQLYLYPHTHGALCCGHTFPRNTYQVEAEGFGHVFQKHKFTHKKQENDVRFYAWNGR